MVRGAARRVVVVKSPDKRIFEEAIFILRESALAEGGATADDIVREACRVASRYAGHSLPKYRRLRYAAYAAAAIIIGAAGWLLGSFFAAA